MRIFIFSALIALSAALPLRVEATPVQSSSFTTQSIIAPAYPELVERIIRYLQQNEGMDYAKLCKLWCEGRMQITKIPVGYLVTATSSEGIVIISVIDDL